MEVTLNRTAPLYAGTGLTVICTVTLDSNVDNSESVRTEWSGPRDISGERYSITNAHVSGRTNTYIGSLTISPLTDQDGGTYTCTGTGINIQHNDASSDVNITVMSE